jgi:hypothetical protein
MPSDPAITRSHQPTPAEAPTYAWPYPRCDLLASCDTGPVRRCIAEVFHASPSMPTLEFG